MKRKDDGDVEEEASKSWPEVDKYVKDRWPKYVSLGSGCDVETPNGELYCFINARLRVA